LENILPAYNDPLFSILLIIVISLIIALATYGWGIYRQQKEQGNLLKFLDKFDSTECALDTTDMPFESHMFKPLALLAKAFENSGEYHKSINIYLYIIKNISDDLTKQELLERLGNTYLHAGFLERARSIYAEILRKKPRNVQVLYELGVVYEMMHKYDKAKEVMDILWFLPNSQLDLDIITANTKLSTLYYAKGYLQKPTVQSGIFSLDMLATARESGFEQGDLLFSYLCKKCKQSFPVSFKRCPNCMAINSVEVEEKIAKSSPKTNYSLL
jgi:lipopolysaccharide biosynthesis regulator YciM